MNIEQSTTELSHPAQSLSTGQEDVVHPVRNSKQKSNLKRTIHYIIMRERRRCCACEMSCRARCFRLILLEIVLMVAGILAVCYAASKSHGTVCQMSFKNLDKDSRGFVSNPRSVVVGDLNHDTQLDIVVANTGTNNIGIFFGFNDGTFADQQTFACDYRSQPYGVALGDFNQDQLLDIAIAQFGTNSIGILFGNNDNHFGNCITIDLGSSRPVSIITADFNNDNILDIATVSYYTSSIGVVLGYSNVSFGTYTMYSTSFDSYPHSLAASDFNNDGRLDIVVANSGTDNVGLFLGNGDGSFSTQKTISTGLYSMPYFITTGDFNNDKIEDIVVANYASDNVGILLGYGNGTFQKILIHQLDIGSGPISIASGYFYDSKNMSLAVLNTKSSTLLFLHGLGNGSFEQHEMYPLIPGVNPISLSCGQFSDDKQLDVVVAENIGNQIEIFNRYTKKAFTKQMNYSTGAASHPLSIAVGDFNNDHYLDITSVDFSSDTLAIFLGNGDGTFKNVTILSTNLQSAPYSVVVGDLNQDNNSDLVITNYGLNTISIHLGNGDGSFEPLATYSVGYKTRPYTAALGDLNNDNHLDIVVVNENTDNVYIFLGYGNGTFADPYIFSTGYGSSPQGVVICDLNKDNQLDIIIGNSELDTVSILFGYGNGTFGSLTSFASGGNSYGRAVAVGDFNNDQCLDIATANLWGDSVGILLGNGNGTFQKPITYLNGSFYYPSWLAIGDFNNDNISDIVVSNSGDDSIALLFGFGNGTFSNPTFYDTGAGSIPAILTTGNFNGDIWLDIAFTNLGSGGIGVFLGSGSINIADKKAYSTGTSSIPWSVAVSDFDNDGLLDVVVANSGTGNIAVHFGDSNGTLSTKTTYLTDLGSTPNFILVADFNQDNNSDIVAAYTNRDGVDVFLGNGNGTFTSPYVYSGEIGSHVSSIAVGDFNNDSHLDLASANQVTNSIDIFLFFDYGYFQSENIARTFIGSGPWSLSIGDFNNDNQFDLAVGNSIADFVTIHLGYANGTFGKPMAQKIVDASIPYWIANGDFNNDGRLDIVVADLGNNYVCVCLGNGDGTFGNIISYSTGDNSGPLYLTVGDVNKDSHLDIVVANMVASNIGVFLGFGNGTFNSMITCPTGRQSLPIFVLLADFNYDGYLDISFVAKGTNIFGIILGDGSGNFQNIFNYSIKSFTQPYRIAIGDFNHDNVLDIVVAYFASNIVAILLGYGNGTFEHTSAYSTGSGSLPSSVVVGHFNNDKNLDIAVANYGSSNVGIFFGYGDGTFTDQVTFSIGDGSRPISIAVHDFNNNNISNVIGVAWSSDYIFVLHRYGSQPFSSHRTIAIGNGSDPISIAVGDFNNDLTLDIAVANYNNDSVGILFGVGNGSFNNELILYYGDIGSRPYCVAVNDLNRDSNLDIVVANSGTSSIGILFGYGNGTFSKIQKYSTGIDSTPYTIAIADFNNDYLLDIGVANYGSNEIRIYFGDANGLFSYFQSFSTGFGSRPHSIAVGDFNQDKWIDLAIANSGNDHVDIVLQSC